MGSEYLQTPGDSTISVRPSTGSSASYNGRAASRSATRRSIWSKPAKCIAAAISLPAPVFGCWRRGGPSLRMRHYSAMKSGLKVILQRGLGFQCYLFLHSIFVALTMRLRPKEGAVLQLVSRLPPDGNVLDIGANVGA